MVTHFQMTINSITDPEILNFISKVNAEYPPDLVDATVEDNRRYYDQMCSVFKAERPSGLTVIDNKISGVGTRSYLPEKSNSNFKILYFHGGGFILGSLDSHDDICAEIASISQTEVIAVDYRLAPEFYYPVQLDDVTNVWQESIKNGMQGIVVGDSAGGTLCASLCIRLKKIGIQLPLAQVLIYPWLGGDFSLPSYIDNSEAPLLRTAEVKGYADLVTNGNTKFQKTDPEFAPLLVSEYGFFPKSLIITADIDPIRDDGKIFHERLIAAGVESTYRNEKQLVHGFLRARHMSKRAKECFTATTDYICDVLESNS